MNNEKNRNDSKNTGKKYISKNDPQFSNERECTVNTSWSVGKGSQQLMWNVSTKNNMTTMQRNSLHKRLSSSHNSLNDSAAKIVDDSMFITQAMSHDTLDDNKILDFYNVPLDSDIYSVPIDFITNQYNIDSVLHKKKMNRKGTCHKNELNLKRRQTSPLRNAESKYPSTDGRKQGTAIDLENEQIKSTIFNKCSECNSKKNNFSFNFKQKLCNIFRISKQHQYLRCKKTILEGHTMQNSCNAKSKCINDYYKKLPVPTRKLPPLPMTADKRLSSGVSLNEIMHTIKSSKQDDKSHIMEFTASIDKVKERGWYWGPISSEGAEKILSNEPDGSFLVRDSSDDHYIFSLTFKLNGFVRHVRIDQDQGLLYTKRLKGKISFKHCHYRGGCWII
ncbi:uncharacterized protein LOC129761119 isoform X2 [Toxorhynchites rutilus septentrionalis]|uniref:uncharacterized protein LOC129761119 isoform X2 n=1 Tax=Toxorhynchites rutilus septentrionalis TaxID=329112 RepID=UPI002478B306|nr:uncharacterized protein LOC129761119 isoform X2 [Toxorhynchites rutilus septentrionalis]